MMKIKDIPKKVRKANFSAVYSTASIIPEINYGIIPFYRRYQNCKTDAAKIKLMVTFIEEKIKEEGKFPNWSVRYKCKDRIWKRAVRIVNMRSNE